VLFANMCIISAHCHFVPASAHMDLTSAVMLQPLQQVYHRSLVSYQQTSSWKVCYPTTHGDDAPWRPYQTTPVTTGEFIMALNQIEVEHQKNAEFLKNPDSVIRLDEFRKQAMAAQKVAEDVSIQENRAFPHHMMIWPMGKKSSSMQHHISVPW